MPGDAPHRPGQLHAPGLGRAAEPGGDVGPGQPLAAQVGELSFLVAESLPQALQQLFPREQLAGAGAVIDHLCQLICLGIATANSILVVTFAREALASGTDPVRAAFEAGLGRFRPVLMTALAMLIGMLPMALGLGDGGEENAPLGRAVFGGLLVATTFTLLFVPVAFATVHGWLKKRAASHQSSPGAVAGVNP